jgi:hypothetical protein
MSTIKKNPNDLQNEEAKTTRPGNLDRAKEKEYLEIKQKQAKKVKGNSDEGVADEKPYDAKNNNIHSKR